MGPVTRQDMAGPVATGAIVAQVLIRNRVQLVTAYVSLSALAVALAGFPERQYLWLWLVGFLLLACAHSPNPVARVIIDWLPVLVLLGGYDFVRGFASDLEPRAIITPHLRFDEILFGGIAPTVLLQDWLEPGKGLHLWDYLAFFFYLSHFVVSPAFALYLYVRDRPRFRRYAMVMLAASLAGFVTYFIVPAAPPWYASRTGDLEHTVRVVQRVWADLGVTGASKAFAGRDTDLANPVAALPSLHAAWPFIMLLFVWRRAPSGRWVALAYNATMWLVLIYGAEHYLSDIMLGWVYAAVAFVLVNRAIDRHDARTATIIAPR